MASFVKSAKGGDKLIYEGFIYVKCGNGKDGKRYWRCETWRSGISSTSSTLTPRAVVNSQLAGISDHFKQALWRKIQELGWTVKYKDEEEHGFRLHLKMFAALTFADTVEVRNWFRKLAQIFLEVYDDGDVDGPYVAFIDYFERTWVGREFVNSRFPLEMWNNKMITIEQLPRTTNSAESWHNASEEMEEYEILLSFLLRVPIIFTFDFIFTTQDF
uniref:FLYWCH-type domain-containing protein n=1 Tax=Meloidogyne incognita TaxID=6306 RepID=A0A914LJQ2_MELIC